MLWTAQQTESFSFPCFLLNSNEEPALSSKLHLFQNWVCLMAEKASKSKTNISFQTPVAGCCKLLGASVERPISEHFGVQKDEIILHLQCPFKGDFLVFSLRVQLGQGPHPSRMHPRCATGTVCHIVPRWTPSKQRCTQQTLVSPVQVMHLSTRGRLPPSHPILGRNLQ